VAKESGCTIPISSNNTPVLEGCGHERIRAMLRNKSKEKVKGSERGVKGMVKLTAKAVDPKL